MVLATYENLVKFLLVLVSLLALVFLEYRVGIVNRFRMLWHLLVNSGVKFNITAEYETDLPSENVRDEFKSVLREMYDEVELSETEDGIEGRVNDEFDIHLDSSDGIKFVTGKIVSTMRDVKRDFADVVRVLETVETRIGDQAGDKKEGFTGRDYSSSIKVPYRRRFLTIHKPLGFSVPRYRIDLESGIYDVEMRESEDELSFSGDGLEGLKSFISKVS